MPKTSETKQYNQRRHLKRARKAVKKPLQECNNNNTLIEDSNLIQDVTFSENDLSHEEPEITQINQDINIDSTLNELYQQIIQIIANNMINFTERTLISLIKIIQIFIQDFKNDSKLLQSRLSFFDTIIQMDYNELLLASSLMETMRYKKGPNEGKLLSKYLQHKAINFIENSFCQASHNIEECIAATKEYNKTIESLKYKLSIIKAENKSLHGRIGKFLQIRKQHISYIRSNARKSPTINKKELKSSKKKHGQKNCRRIGRIWKNTC
ncbi:7397_t:CDS:2 [Gigaspora rosea]|nr:7397_t:CDS:2 [Gigaspora rosea]